MCSPFCRNYLKSYTERGNKLNFLMRMVGNKNTLPTLQFPKLILKKS